MKSPVQKKIEGLTRLALLARKLRAMRLGKRRQFVMEQWMTCGSAGCALGWAATMPEFKKLGLGLRKIGVDAQQRTVYEPIYKKTYAGYYAAVHAFDIPLSTAMYLFSPNRYGLLPPTKEVVADRIDTYILNGGAS